MIWLKLVLGNKLISETRRNLLPEEPAALLQWSPGPSNTQKEGGTHDLALESTNFKEYHINKGCNSVDN